MMALHFGAMCTANAFALKDRMESRWQAVTGPGPEFDVATIKPANPADGQLTGVDIAEDGLVRIGHVPLIGIVAMAWNVAFWQVEVKGNEWISKTEYNVQAKPPQSTGVSYSQRHSYFSIADPQLRKMLQALVIERFQLKFHKEERQGPVYLLERNERAKLVLVPVPEPTGASIQTSRARYPSDGVSMVEGNGFAFHDMSMLGLAKALGDLVYHHTVLDRTELKGTYNFRSKTITTAEDFQTNRHNDLFIAAIKEAGLQLRETKGPNEYLILDSASAPSAN